MTGTLQRKTVVWVFDGYSNIAIENLIYLLYWVLNTNFFRKLCDLCLDCDKLHDEGGMEKEEEVENRTCREAEGNVSRVLAAVENKLFHRPFTLKLLSCYDTTLLYTHRNVYLLYTDRQGFPSKTLGQIVFSPFEQALSGGRNAGFITANTKTARSCF